MIDNIIEVDYDKLAKHLGDLSKLTGPMIWSKAGKKAYNDWFYPYRESEVDDKTGTHDRMNDHIIKVAACISLARKADMVLEDDDIEEAIVACSSLSNTARKVAGMDGKSSTTGILKSFLVIMFNAPGYELTRKQVLQKGFGDFDSYELDKTIETLTQTGFVVQSQGGKEIKYKLTKGCIDWWQRNTKDKK